MGSAHAQQVPSTFFALDINNDDALLCCTSQSCTIPDPWPSTVTSPYYPVYFSTFRAHDSGGKQGWQNGMLWSDIEKGNNTYDWTSFDPWFNTMTQYGQKMMFTAYWTPSWAVPDDATCTNTLNRSRGGCLLPGDVDSGDTTWTTFISALLSHVQGLNGGTGLSNFGYLEVWNEPDQAVECDPNYTGLFNQCLHSRLTKMTQDAHTIVQSYNSMYSANIQVISPPVTSGAVEPGGYLSKLLADGVANYADIIGFHSYTQTADYDFIDVLQDVTSLVSQYTTKPVYNTEGSWLMANMLHADGSSTDIGCYRDQTDGQECLNEQAAWLGTEYLIQAYYATASPNTLAGYAFYTWDSGPNNKDNDVSALWDTTWGFLQSSTDNLTPAGVAYTIVYQWLLGATPNGACTGGVAPATWTCNFSNSGFGQARAVWYSCPNNEYFKLPPGSGGCSSTYSTNYTYYRDLAGNKNQVQNNTVTITPSPILLSNQ